MSTRSRIGILNSDGSVDSIYCHFDGYTSNNGKILVENYTNEAKIRELLSLGDLSSLGEEIGVKHPFDCPHLYGTPGYQAFKATYGNMCNAYGRDRGETGIESKHSANVESYLTIAEEYNYLFYYGRWMVHSYATDENWRQVTEQLAIEEAEEEEAA